MPTIVLVFIFEAPLLFIIRDEIAYEHDLRGPELGALVFRLGEFDGGVLQAERDGLARGLVLIDRDLHRVYAVGTVEHAKRGDAVVGAVAVEAGDGAGGFFAVHRDPHLAAVGSEQVVDLAAGAAEREAKRRAGRARVPHLAHAIRERAYLAVGGRELLPVADEHGGLDVYHLRRLEVVGHERRAQGGGVVGGRHVLHLRETVDDRGEVEAVSGGRGMYAVLREKRLSCAGAEVLSAHHERAGLDGVDHARTEADGRDAVVVGELLHGARGAVACTGEVVLLHGFGDRVGEYDVGSRVLLPRLAHDALHGTPDVLRRRSAVVGGELHEEEVGVVAECVVLHAERAEIRSGTADGGVNFLELRLRVGGAEPFRGEVAPAVHRCDGAAEVGDPHLLAGLDLLHEVSHARAHAHFLRRDGTRVDGICEYADGKRGRREENLRFVHICNFTIEIVVMERTKSD